MAAWVAILDRSGDQGRRARELASAVARRTASDAGDLYEQALLCGELALAEDDATWRDEAIGLLNASIRRVDELDAAKRWGLFGGLAGLGWVTEQLAETLMRRKVDLNRDTDAALLRELERGRWQQECDVADLGVYFLRRGHRDGAKLVMAHLEDRSPSVTSLHFLDLAIAAGIESERAAALARAAIAGTTRPDAATAVHCHRLGGSLNDERMCALAECWSPDGSTAHALNVLYQMTGDTRALGEARKAIDSLLERELQTLSSHDALALLSATTPVAPQWHGRTFAVEEP